MAHFPGSFASPFLFLSLRPRKLGACPFPPSSFPRLPPFRLCFLVYSACGRAAASCLACFLAPVAAFPSVFAGSPRRFLRCSYCLWLVTICWCTMPTGRLFSVAPSPRPPASHFFRRLGLPGFVWLPSRGVRAGSGPSGFSGSFARCGPVPPAWAFAELPSFPRWRVSRLFLSLLPLLFPLLRPFWFSAGLFWVWLGASLVSFWLAAPGMCPAALAVPYFHEHMLCLLRSFFAGCCRVVFGRLSASRLVRWRGRFLTAVFPFVLARPPSAPSWALDAFRALRLLTRQGFPSSFFCRPAPLVAMSSSDPWSSGRPCFLSGLRRITSSNLHLLGKELRVFSSLLR